MYEEAKDAKDEEDESLKHKLPPLEEGQSLRLEALKPEQHFTEPPPRFNEASLVKELEERGIGRPSTYAAIMSTIVDRGYVQKTAGRGGKFFPTEIGFVVTELLVANLKDIFDYQFTARMEEELDEIEEGKIKWTAALHEFYGKFEQDLEYAGEHMENVKRMEKATDQKCERCGAPLVLKWGKHGSFFACSTFDKKDPNSCTFTKENPINLTDLGDAEISSNNEEEFCENCGKPMVLKRGRFGTFMACTGYPECKTTRRLDSVQKKPDTPLEEKCPDCGRNLLLRNGRFGEFISCSGYPECKYIKQNLIGVKCPDLQDRRDRREEGPPRQLLLRLQPLSRVRLHRPHQAGRRDLPRMRQPLPVGEDHQGRNLPDLPQQQGPGQGEDGGEIGEGSQGGKEIGCQERQGRRSRGGGRVATQRRLPMPNRWRSQRWSEQEQKRERSGMRRVASHVIRAKAARRTWGTRLSIHLSD